MNEQRNSMIVSALFFVTSFLSLVAVLSLNIDMGSTGFIVSGAVTILVAVILAGSVAPLWGVIGGLLLVGVYLIARGAGYLNHAYLRFAIIACLIVLMVLYAVSFVRSYKQNKNI